MARHFFNCDRANPWSDPFMAAFMVVVFAWAVLRAVSRRFRFRGVRGRRTSRHARQLRARALFGPTIHCRGRTCTCEHVKD